ncbi:hypothetical protein DPX39_080005600 [Trypanosoma brucei equiperdum]|uniref:Uncharacterized protein n=1 Tax=Trypanosoma brucei equiperdum TaxID=630700 RepID=A0A3L6L2D0_9TRYP|nr:hypothetical protein DPX39_080005600 [Trypanosoma brucei equiperdum]
MGHSAKITRGGDKNRVNQGRREAKMRAKGAKHHTVSAKESIEVKRAHKKNTQAIAMELRAKSKAQSHAIVTMAPKVKGPEA